jgi:hypothetical protein
MHTELHMAEAMIRIKGPQRSVTCQAFVQSHISRLQVGEPKNMVCFYDSAVNAFF